MLVPHPASTYLTQLADSKISNGFLDFAKMDYYIKLFALQVNMMTNAQLSYNFLSITYGGKGSDRLESKG